MSSAKVYSWDTSTLKHSRAFMIYLATIRNYLEVHDIFVNFSYDVF